MPPEPPKLSPLQIGISAAAAVTTTIAGSLFSDRGTVVGAGLGSVISGVAVWAYARVVHHARAGLPSVRVSRRQVVIAGGVMAVTLPATLLTVTAFEAASGQTLHAATTSAKESGGTTLGTTLGNPVRPSPSILGPSGGIPSPSVSVAVPSGAATVSPTPSATVTEPSGNPSALLEPQPTPATSTPPSVFAPSGASPTQPAATGGTP